MPSLQNFDSSRSFRLICLSLNASSLPTSYECSVLPGVATLALSDGCPASEWEAGFVFFLKGSRSLPSSLPPLQQALLSRQIPESVEVTGKSSIRQLTADYGGFPYETFSQSGTLKSGSNLLALSSTQHAAVADALTNTATLWTNAIQYAKPAKGHGAPFSDQQEAVHTIDNYYQPYVISMCGADSIQGPNDQSLVYFPTTMAQAAQATNSSLFRVLDGGIIDSGILAAEYPPLTKSQILNISGSLTDNRIKWVGLPLDANNFTSLGVVILPPTQEKMPSSTTTMTQTALFCSIYAGWGLSTLNESTIGNTASRVSSLPMRDNSGLNLGQYNDDQSFTKGGAARSFYEAQNDPFNWDFGTYPSRPIAIDPTWAEYLNPLIDGNNTVLNTIFSYIEAGAGAETPRTLAVVAPQILSMLVANGIARVGFDKKFQGKPKLSGSPSNGTTPLVIDGDAWLAGKGDVFSVDPDESKDWVQFKVTSTIKGFAYNTKGSGPKVAVTFLLAYCTVALLHVCYNGITGTSASTHVAAKLDVTLSHAFARECQIQMHIGVHASST